MGTVIHCEMLHRTNLIAMVGGGPRPKFADNTILIYDDVLKKFVLEYTFTQPVVAVHLKRDRYNQLFAFVSFLFHLKDCVTLRNATWFTNTIFILCICRLIAVLRRQIHVFSFPNNSKKLFTLETRDNPKGLCQINSLISSEKQLLICLGHKLGSIQLVVCPIQFSSSLHIHYLAFINYRTYQSLNLVFLVLLKQ